MITTAMTSFHPMFLIVIFAVATLLPSFFTFARLVRREHDVHRESWEADGRPHGLFWRPRSSGFWSSIRSGFATNSCMLIWVLRTPTWVRRDDEALRLLRRLRWFVGAWNIAVVVYAAIFLLMLFWSPRPG